MIKKTWIVILCLLLLHTTVAAAESAQAQPKRPTISLTMFIPGIQQIKTRQYFKGGMFLTAFIGSITGTIVYNNKGNDWYDAYSRSTNVADILLYRKYTEDSFKKRNLCIVGIFSLWLLHVVDLKFFKSEKGGINGSIGKNNIHLGFYYSF